MEGPVACKQHKIKDRNQETLHRPYTMKVTYGSCHVIYHTIPMSKTAHNILAQLSKYFPLSPTCTIQPAQNLQKPQHVQGDPQEPDIF